VPFNNRADVPLHPTFSSLKPAVPTKVFDTFWKFAAERQATFFRRMSGDPPPWTDDDIIREYKFTNVYRASDRVSQFLIRRVIYEGEQSAEEIFFRTILFKFFNSIETWELLSLELGPPSHAAYDRREYDRVLTDALARGKRIFSAAYIMPSGSSVFGKVRKHQALLSVLERMMADDIPVRISECRSMMQVFNLLKTSPLIGDFLAYQFAIDLNYGLLTDFSEMEFVMPGPGARGGIAKCFASLGGLSERDIIRVVADRQDVEFAQRGLRFESLWGRPLQLIDCQNVFCEVDKYSRIRHPDVVSRSDRTRIKQKFRPQWSRIEYWFPPKWELNDRISRT
jgi:hypothetical protein